MFTFAEVLGPIHQELTEQHQFYYSGPFQPPPGQNLEFYMPVQVGLIECKMESIHVHHNLLRSTTQTNLIFLQ